jgi:hypothetical protein
MKTPIHLALGIFVLSASLATQGGTLDFDFSFQNTIGTVNGTVTGEILGLANNSTGPASEVLITGFPAGLDSTAGATPINAMSWIDQVENTFTVVNGQVVSGGFWAQQTVGVIPYGYQLYVDGEIDPTDFVNYLNLDGNNNNYVWNTDSLAAASLAAANIVPAGNVSVPDSGSAFSLLGMAIAGLGVLRRKTVA